LTVNFIDTLAVTLVAIVRRNKKRDPARVSFVSLSFPSCLSILLPNILARNSGNNQGRIGASMSASLSGSRHQRRFDL
jgi:hypothetical protein